MSTRKQCERYVGKWVTFRTPYGVHRGIIERVTHDKAVILSPKTYVPAQLASVDISMDELKRLDVVHAWGGPGFAPGAGAGGYGYGWGGLWARWAVSFLIIYLLWGLWW